MWQHPFAIGIISFSVCLLAVWLYARRKPNDFSGQWLILLVGCLFVQITVSLFMVLPVSDEWKLNNMMRTYWKIGQPNHTDSPNGLQP